MELFIVKYKQSRLAGGKTLIAMETIILSILSTLFAGTTLWQFVFFRSYKKKNSAEASKAEVEVEKAVAEVSQEEAKADRLHLENIQTVMSMREGMLIKTLEENKQLVKENEELRKIVDDFRHVTREFEYRFGDYDRKIKGMEKIIREEIARRSYAEGHICLNLPCKDRIPKLGQFNKEGKNE